MDSKFTEFDCTKMKPKMSFVGCKSWVVASSVQFHLFDVNSFVSGWRIKTVLELNSSLVFSSFLILPSSFVYYSFPRTNREWTFTHFLFNSTIKMTNILNLLLLFYLTLLQIRSLVLQIWSLKCFFSLHHDLCNVYCWSFMHILEHISLAPSFWPTTSLCRV